LRGDAGRPAQEKKGKDGKAKSWEKRIEKIDVCLRKGTRYGIMSSATEKGELARKRKRRGKGLVK